MFIIMSTLPKKVVFGPKPEVPPRPRANSITGLTSLSKCVIEHEAHMDDMKNIIHELKANITDQDAIIKAQETALKDAVGQLTNLKDEINKIWNS
jgi:hypothetical protein